MEQKGQRTLLKWVLIGCGTITIVGCTVITLIGWWLFSGPKGGVKLGHEMDEYAVRYLAEHKLLNPGEEVLAYYDATISMNGTEAAILTNDRIISHKAPRSTAFYLKDVADIRHRYETVMGDIIEIEDTEGKLIKIEIAPFNQGETFNNALMGAWRTARKPPASP